MKVTNFGTAGFPLALAGWSTGDYSVNSNFNTSDGGFSALNFVQGITANGSNMLTRPIANFAAGSNIWLSLDSGPGGSYPSNTIRIHGSAGGGGSSYTIGSNASRVSEDASAGASTTILSAFDHRHDGIGTITSSSSNTMQRGTWNIRPGSGIALSLTDTDGDGEFDTTTISTTSGGGGSSSATDKITSMFGTPDTAFEFQTSSLSGLTALSNTPDAEDANTSVPDCYYIADNATATAWCGRYITIPSYPFTAMIKVDSWNPRLNFQSVGIFVSVTTPGKMFIHNAALLTRVTRTEIFTNPTTFSSTPGTGLMDKLPTPCYLALVAASTTSVTTYSSMDGITWERVVSASNPSMTIGSVGFAMKNQDATGAGVAVAIDWFRVWNSSKTFLTGV